LHEWGHRVAWVTRPSGPRPPLAESLPPSTRKVLAAVGLLPAIEAAGFVGSTGNTSWWGSATARVETFGGRADANATGWQVLRGDLEAVFQRSAVSAGVRVRGDARVRAVAADGAGEGVRLEVDGNARGSEVIEAAYVVDASGRAGVVARRG